MSASMFAAVMDDCVASRIDTHPSIETVLPDVGTPFDFDEGPNSVQESQSAVNTTSKQRLRKRLTDSQVGAPPDLRFVSAPTGPGLSIDDTAEYYYDDSAGEGMTVYVIDTGANPQNPDFYTMDVEPKWLWPPEEVWNDLLTDEFDQPYESFTDTTGHGACVVSKVAGFDWGVAKKASVVIVKLITGSTEANSDDLLSSSVICSLNLVLQDMEERATQGVPINGKAIVNMSFGIQLNSGDPADAAWIREYELAIRSMLLLDAVVVTTAGNHRGDPGRSDNVDQWPALLAGLYPDMIVVGGVNEYGVEYEHSQRGRLVNVWGPAVDIKCASQVGEDDIEETGTSMAAGMVSGLAAYFMALYPELQRPGTGLTSRAVKNWIIQYSWARENFLGDPDRVFPVAIWNGLSSPLGCLDSDEDSNSDDSKMRRRDTTDASSCPRLSSTFSRSSSNTTLTTLVTSSAITSSAITSSAITSSASSTPSSNASSSCNNGKVYGSLESCQEGCRSGTCSATFKCECSTPDESEHGGLD